METLPFAHKVPQNSTWGFSGFMRTAEDVGSGGFRESPPATTNGPQSYTPDSKYDEYMPAVLLNSLKKDKKPFTYTPGRVDLSEVLNDKLQKRMERRKEKVRIPQPRVEETPKQVLVMPTYNSPLNMYSMENALEVLEVQAELTVSDKNPNSPPHNNAMTLPRNYKYEAKDFEPKNVTQSKAFRVLQIITDTEEEEAEGSQKMDTTEMQFSGIRDNNVIPSKFFHNLQRITNTETENDTNNQNKGQQMNVISHHDERRFKGVRNSSEIPSKLFHNLQRMTNTEPSNNTNQENRGFYQGYNAGTFKSESPVPASVAKFSYNDTHEASPVLKRPAAFLPAKHQPMPSSKHYSTSYIQHALRKAVGPFDGTDF